MMIGQHLAHVSQHPWGNWWCLVTRIDQPGVPAAVSRCCPQRVSLVGYEDWIPGWRIMGLSEQNGGTPLNPWVNHHYRHKNKIHVDHWGGYTRSNAPIWLQLLQLVSIFEYGSRQFCTPYVLDWKQSLVNSCEKAEAVSEREGHQESTVANSWLLPSGHMWESEVARVRQLKPWGV